VIAATLSIVLPIWRSDALLAELVEEYLALVPHFFTDFELVLVDNGNSEATSALLNDLVATHAPVMVVRCGQNEGYGQALATGMRNARGDYVLATAQESSVHIGELARFLPYHAQYPVILGYRLAQTNQPFPGEKLATKLVNQLLGLDLHDLTTQFALFHGDAVRNLTIQTSGILAYPEIYHFARKQSLPTIQVGLQKSSGSKKPALRWPGYLELAFLRDLGNLSISPSLRPAWLPKVIVGVGLLALVRNAWRKPNYR